MPWNSIRPYVSHFAYGKELMPPEGWPVTRVWLTHFQRDVRRLRSRPLWHSAEFHHEFRAWAERPELAFKVSEMSEGKDEEPFALIFQFWSVDHEGIIVDDYDELVMHGVHHTVSVTRDLINLHGLGKHAMSWIVDCRNDRHPATYRLRATEPKDMRPEDVAALEGLIR